MNRTSKFLAIVIIAIVVQSANSAVYLYNPGFTNGSGTDADNWIEDGDAARQSWGSHDGDGYLMSLPGYTTNTYGEFYQNVANITVGKIFTLSFWQEGDNGAWNGSNVTVRLIWLDSGSNKISSVTKDIDDYTGYVPWTNLNIAGRSPHNTEFLRVQFDANSPGSTNGSGAAKFDDLTLTETTGLFNPGFAYGSGVDPDNWTENSVAGASRQTWGSHDGDGWLMALPGYNTNTYGEFYQDIDVVMPGDIYTFSFWLQGDVLWNGSNVMTRLIWYDSNTNEINNTSNSLDTYTGNSSWTNLYLKTTAPNNAIRLRVQFDAESPFNGGGAVKVDDLILSNAAPSGMGFFIR